jgi:glycosyltransferase involved in cell wall biosynthesis
MPASRRRLQARPRAVYVGRLSAEKNLGALLDAIDQVDVPIELTVVGDGLERASLEARSERLGLSERVEFMGFQSDVTPWLSEADFAVMPSRREGLPMAAIEALAAGLPMLASRVGGLPSLIDDGRTGVLVDVDQPGALAAGLEQMLEQHDLLAQQTFDGVEQLRDQFSSTLWARRHLDLYESIWAIKGQ